MPYLARITIYPIKSLDGVDVAEALVLPSGAIQHDRRLAIVDAEGRFVNGKRTPAVHLIRSSFDPRERVLFLEMQGQYGRHTFHLDSDRDAVEAWLAAVFGFPTRLREDAEGGFPDDRASPGPTIASTATWEEVASWFPSLTVADIRRRFRANLEVEGVEPFWEDRLFTEPGSVVRFRVGEVVFEGVNPCQRCVVPSRAPTTGEPLPGFAKTFVERRRERLSAWAAVSRFDHFYRLAVNTRLHRWAGGTIRVGDEVVILDVSSSQHASRPGVPVTKPPGLEEGR